MNTDSEITCHCGQRIQEKDFLQRGRFPQILSPGFVYVKFRCSRCKRLGERFIPQRTPLTQPAHTPEVSGDELVRFGAMGGIDLDEVIDFHFQLESRPLADLIAGRDF